MDLALNRAAKDRPILCSQWSNFIPGLGNYKSLGLNRSSGSQNVGKSNDKNLRVHFGSFGHDGSSFARLLGTSRAYKAAKCVAI
jgi:hypothetical protein